MLVDEIKFGESVNIEFKREVPQKSEKYIKSVIAFANTAGGKIVIGIDDETHEIVGVEKDGVFKIIDNITNTISDMCCPQIFPNIGVNTIDGKSVIVINIYPGRTGHIISSHLEKRQALTSEYRERPDPLMKRS